MSAGTRRRRAAGRLRGVAPSTLRVDRVHLLAASRVARFGRFLFSSWISGNIVPQSLKGILKVTKKLLQLHLGDDDSVVTSKQVLFPSQQTFDL